MSGMPLAVELAQHRHLDSLSHLRIEWPLALALSIFFLVRGLYLRRPLSRNHIIAALALVVIARLGYDAHRAIVGFTALALTGAVLVLPKSSRPTPEELPRISALVDKTEDDVLAPFVMHSAKSFYFNAAGTAALGYRARLGIAAVAGDPVGESNAFPGLIEEFTAFAADNGWRVAVLAAGEYCAPLWARDGLRAVPIGRDVEIDIPSFTLQGRPFRNLRQAVNRTHNAGITTEIVLEAKLDVRTVSQLWSIVDSSNAGHQNRGFSMILDHLLDGRHPGMLIAIARDSNGVPVAFHRYATADHGRVITLDVPWRDKSAPNGVDERLSVDVALYGQAHGARKLSLAFAAFPEIFDDVDRHLGSKLVYLATHALDPLIAVESLYRFVRKFRALGGRRFAMIRLRQVGTVLVALLILEFVPHRKRA